MFWNDFGFLHIPNLISLAPVSYKTCLWASPVRVYAPAPVRAEPMSTGHRAPSPTLDGSVYCHKEGPACGRIPYDFFALP